MTTTLTPADLEFLSRPLYGFVTTAAGPLPPQPRPVWFDVTASGSIQFFTDPHGVRVRRLHRDPRASFVVAAPVGERERWISVSGSVSLDGDGGPDLVKRLAARYWELDDPVRADELAELLAQDWVRVLIEPESVARYAMDSP